MEFIDKRIKTNREELEMSVNTKLIDELRQEIIDLELKLVLSKSETLTLKRKNKQLFHLVTQLKREQEAMTTLESYRGIFRIKAQRRTKDINEGTPVLVASDWHTDEIVRRQSVNGLNVFNPKVAQARATKFFQNSLQLISIVERDIEVKTVVFAILGDMISGHIHDELKSNNSMLPMDAILFVQEILIGGINHLLKNTEHNFVIPCCVGNHSRITQKIHKSGEQGQSLEYLMYHVMANRFKDNPRVQFIIPEGYHCYLRVLGKTLRFHHGHAMLYYGGVAGITLPVKKAIAQWNKVKHADIDIFGHFHQWTVARDFICNGSLVGYNAFALSIKADFAPPEQAFFLIDKKRGRTINAPIVLE